MLIKKLKYHFLPIVFLILVTILVHHVWFFNLSPITYGDWTIDHIEKIREHLALPLIWKGDNNFGGVELGIFFWPLQVLIGSFAYLVADPNLSERLFILWPVALITPISMYSLSYYVLRSRTAALISAIIFTFNTFLIISRSGPLLLHMATTFIPIYLLFFIKTLESKMLSFSLITALVGFVVAFCEFRIFYIAVWILFFYFIYHLLFIKPKDKTNIRLFVLTALTVIIPILLNLYALLGLHNLQSLTSNEIFNRTLFGASYLKLSKIMTLFHPDWTGGKIEGWVVKPILPRFFLAPILALLGLVFTKNKKVIFFAFLALLSIFLTKLTLYPFPDTYQWLFDNVPGFNAFRESGKFGYFIPFSYAILIGAFVQFVLNWPKNQKQKFLSAAFAIFVGFIFLLNTKPVILGELGSLYVQRQVPADYFIVKDSILGHPEYFRTLWIPLASQWGIKTYNHPIVSNYPVNQAIWNKFVKQNNGNIFGVNFTDHLLDISSIKYVILPLADKQNEDDFFRFAGARSDFISELERLKYLKKINIGTKEVILYENEGFKPHIYITYEEESIKKAISFESVAFSFKRPTEYKITLSDISDPFYLNFAESYHPDWKIRVGEFNWFDVLWNKKYFLPDKDHFQNGAGLNSFFIDPVYIKNYSDQNSDLNLTLYFRPQSYVYLGLIISGITFALCIFCLLIIFVRRSHKNGHD